MSARQRAAIAKEQPLPKVGRDRTQEADADERLATDAGITVDSLRWRAAYRERQIAGETQRYALAEAVVAETPQVDTRGKAKAVLGYYLDGMSRLVAPSRAYDTGIGPAAIGNDAHLDRLDLEVWLAAQSDATRELAYLILTDAKQSELAVTFGVDRATVAHWAAQLAEAVEAGVPFRPARQRARRN